MTPVAPYVGAWIETKFCYFPYFEILSHPMWVRGLKQHNGTLSIKIK